MPATGRVSTVHSGVIRPPRPDGLDQFPRQQVDIVVIGGGPAGLSVGFELKRRGLSFLILERGASVGESWRNMPKALRLVSPWKCNSLPGTDKGLFPRHHQMTREEFLRYLQAYAEKMELPVRTESDVDTVERLPEGLFHVQTSQGTIFARVVVNATGYFSNPLIPAIPGARESRIPQLHFADYRDPQHIAELASKRHDQSRSPRENSLILIVGKRLSAGQVMVELVEAGFSAALSHCSPIQYGAEPWAWWFLFRIFPWLEWLKLKTKGARAPSNDVRMAGGIARSLLERGNVKTFPPIQRFDAEAIVFENGEQLHPDLVLYATGFRPALQHLADLDISICPETGRPKLHQLESVSVPGLHFIGLDHARNFQSRFLRGIRKDAAFLADRLKESILISSAASSSRDASDTSPSPPPGERIGVRGRSMHQRELPKT